MGNILYCTILLLPISQQYHPPNTPHPRRYQWRPSSRPVYACTCVRMRVWASLIKCMRNSRGDWKACHHTEPARCCHGNPCQFFFCSLGVRGGWGWDCGELKGTPTVTIALLGVYPARCARALFRFVSVRSPNRHWAFGPCTFQSELLQWCRGSSG